MSNLILLNIISGIIGTLSVILIFACPSLETAKIILFSYAEDEISLKGYIIEYIYLLVMISFPLGLIFSALKGRCCRFNGLMNYIREQLCCLPILILIIASIYTHMTLQDVKPIPNTCPSNYPYKLSITRAACLIRLINFISMWTFVTLFTILSIVDCFGYFPRKENDKNFAQARLSDWFPPERDDDETNKV